MGSLEYRVMRTPKPEPKFLALQTTKLKRAKLTSSNAKLYAELNNFVFDIKYNITGFSVDVNQRGEIVTRYAKGNKVTPEMKELFEALPVGSPISFNNISCKGPDGAPKITSIYQINSQLNLDIIMKNLVLIFTLICFTIHIFSRYFRWYPLMVHIKKTLEMGKRENDSRLSTCKRI